MDGIFFDGSWSDLDMCNLSSPLELNCDGMWKKFELIESPPLSPSRQDDDLLSLQSLMAFSAETLLETPPDSGDELEPLAGIDCMWSSTSQALQQTVLSSSPGSTKNVQLKFKMSDDAPAEKYSPFPFSLNDPLTFIHRPTTLKRPADSGTEFDLCFVCVSVLSFLFLARPFSLFDSSRVYWCVLSTNFPV